MKIRRFALLGLIVYSAGCSLFGSKTSNSPSNANGLNIKSGGFLANLPDGFSQPSDDVGRRLLKEYGSLFVARGGVTPPLTVVFKNEAEVAAFQAGIQSVRESVSGIATELQTVAMKNLKEAVAEAKKGNLSITPRGADASKRNYQDTETLWKSRIDPGLKYWAAKGRVSQVDAQRIRALTPYDQVSEIFALEDQGIFFSKDNAKSVIYSVAPPGSSQHLSLLALDVSEHENSTVRSILAKHGWFQTVVSDLPHFTFMGVSEKALPKLGLKAVTDGGRTFWVPEL